MSALPAKILLATDGSKEAELATRMATEMAERLGSELHVVYIGRIPSIYALPEAEVVDPDMQERLRELAGRESRDKLEEQVRKVEEAGGEVAGSHLRIGRPDAEIVRVAEEIGADMIVMGSRGLGGLRRAVMGSVSDSVVRHAHCPVMIVRDEARS